MRGLALLDDLKAEEGEVRQDELIQIAARLVVLRFVEAVMQGKVRPALTQLETFRQPLKSRRGNKRHDDRNYTVRTRSSRVYVDVDRMYAFLEVAVCVIHRVVTEPQWTEFTELWGQLFEVAMKRRWGEDYPDHTELRDQAFDALLIGSLRQLLLGLRVPSFAEAMRAVVLLERVERQGYEHKNAKQAVAEHQAIWMACRHLFPPEKVEEIDEEILEEIKTRGWSPDQIPEDLFLGRNYRAAVVLDKDRSPAVEHSASPSKNGGDATAAT